MPPPHLTPRQLAIVQLVMRGDTYEAIAAALGVRRDTVAHQVAAARHAWGAVNNAQLTALLIGAGVVPAPERQAPPPDEGGPDGGRIAGLVLAAVALDAAELWATVPVTALLELF